MRAIVSVLLQRMGLVRVWACALSRRGTQKLRVSPDQIQVYTYVKFTMAGVPYTTGPGLLPYRTDFCKYVNLCIILKVLPHKNT